MAWEIPDYFSHSLCWVASPIILTVPTNSAGVTQFEEDFESAGFLGWTVTPVGAVRECTVKQSGVCNLKFNGAAGGAADGFGFDVYYDGVSSGDTFPATWTNAPLLPWTRGNIGIGYHQGG